MLPLIYSTMVTIGYQSSTIYDIPNLGASGDTSVPAVTFQAICRSIPNLAQVAGPDAVPVASGSMQAISFPFSIGAEFQDVNVVPGKAILRALR